MTNPVVDAVALKPCPGCAKCSTRVIGGPGTAGGPKYWAGCDYCNWRTWGDTEVEAIAAWNRRSADAALVEALEAIEAMLSLYAGDISAAGEAYKIADAALTRGERT